MEFDICQIIIMSFVSEYVFYSINERKTGLYVHRLIYFFSVWSIKQEDYCITETLFRLSFRLEFNLKILLVRFILIAAEVMKH